MSSRLAIRSRFHAPEISTMARTVVDPAKMADAHFPAVKIAMALNHWFTVAVKIMMYYYSHDGWLSSRRVDIRPMTDTKRLIIITTCVVVCNYGVPFSVVCTVPQGLPVGGEARPQGTAPSDPFFEILFIEPYKITPSRTSGSGDLGIWGSGDLGIWGSGDLGIWGSRDMPRSPWDPMKSRFNTGTVNRKYRS